MPNAVDRFSQVYNQVRTRPPVASGGTPVAMPQTAIGPAHVSSVYIPDPNRRQQPTATSVPWNNPNYPVPRGTTPPMIPPSTGGYPGNLPTQGVQNYPVGYPAPTYPYGGYPNIGYPNSGYPGAYPVVGPLTAVLGSLTPVVKDKGYQRFVNDTAPIIDTAIPLLGTIVGLIGSTRRSTTPSTPQGTNPGAPFPAPVYQGYPQQTYPQPVNQLPAYPVQQERPYGVGYGTRSDAARETPMIGARNTSFVNAGPSVSIGLDPGLSRGIQDVGNLVQSIGNMFR